MVWTLWGTVRRPRKMLHLLCPSRVVFLHFRVIWSSKVSSEQIKNLVQFFFSLKKNKKSKMYLKNYFWLKKLQNPKCIKKTKMYLK